MTKLLPLILSAMTMSAMAAQDPLKTLPGSYTLQFENDWVRVIRVHYAPQARLPVHAHNALPAAYVYLNDGGPVRFGHIGTSYGAATRPPTRTGSFRVYRGLDEVHEVENLSDLPSHFLRIEFKTTSADLVTLRGRFHRDPVAPGESVDKTQFENGQVRITRLTRAPGQPFRIVTSASEPALLVATGDTRLRAADGTEVALRAGQERWVAAGSTLVLANAGTGTSELLRFDLRTSPLTAPRSR